jgi:hypothetical protein
MESHSLTSLTTLHVSVHHFVQDASNAQIRVTERQENANYRNGQTDFEIYCPNSVPLNLMEHDRGALPGNAVLPVIVGGVHRSAAEHTSDGAGSIGTIVSNASPGGRGANVTSVVVGDERLHTHKLLQAKN